MVKFYDLCSWIIVLVLFSCSYTAFAQVCETEPCPGAERCFERTATGAPTAFVCECAAPGGIGFECLNTNIPYTDLFTCYGRECTSSSFSTPSFPSAYPANYRAVYLIFVPGGEEITFQLGFPYDIGPGDFLYVGSGLDFSGTDLLRPSIPGEFYVFGTNDGTIVPFTMFGDAFWMYFVSDATNNQQSQGFGMVWTARMITTQGPEIVDCPMDLSIIGPAGLSQVSVTWVPPSSTDPSAVVTSNRSPGDFFNIPSVTTVTYTFTAAGAESTCSFVITIRDAGADAPPVVSNCPGPITEPADGTFSGALVDWRAPDVTDDSPGMLDVTQSHTPPEFFAIGDHMVTYTFTDSAGNSEICSFLVSVVDVTPPTFTQCPTDITMATASPGGVSVTWPQPSASDNSAQVTVTSDFASGDTFSFGDTRVIYRAVDSSGNEATCEFTVTISNVDQATDVAITGCPGDMMVTAENGETFMFVTWTPPTGVDLLTGQTIVPLESVRPNSFFRVGSETVVRYTFISSSGQSEVCSFTIMVVAGAVDGLQVEGCSSDIVEVAPQGFNFVTVSWQEPTAFDQFNNQVVGESAIAPGSYFEVGSSTRITYEFADNFGNTALCSFLVTVQSIGDELMVEGCPSEIFETIPANSATVQVFWTPPTVSANAIGDVETLSNFQPGDRFPTGENIVTYSFTDSTGSSGLCSFTVTVEDLIPPDLICPSTISRTISALQQCLTVSWEIPLADDNSGISPIVTSSLASGSCLDPGTTVVTVTATDLSGNSVSCEFLVEVTSIDEVAPDLICPSTISRTISGFQQCLTVTWEIPFAEDNSGIDPVVTSNPASGSCLGPGTTVVTVTATDLSGNSATCEFSVLVNREDTEPPTLLCPSDITRSIPVEDGCVDVTWEIPLATDNSGGQVDLSSTPASGTCFPVNTVRNVIVTAIDPSGNIETCQFTVTVSAAEDTTPPFVLCPNDFTRSQPVEQTCSELTWEIPFVQDDSGFVTVVSMPASGSCFVAGVTVVMVTATDPSGNSDVCSFSVDVIPIDFDPPTLQCPGDITREVDPADSLCVEIAWEIPFVSDNSGENVEVISSPASGTCFFVGTVTNVLVTAEDLSGNLERCQFTVTVIQTEIIDVTPPTLVCPADILRDIPVESPCLQVSWEVPFVSDDSGGNVAITSAPRSGDCFVAGTTPVTVTARDPSNNPSTCDFDVILTPVDTEPPTVICPSDISRSIDVLQTCLEISWQIPFTSDNSQDFVNTVSMPESGSCFAAGMRTVTVTATDASGNQNSCQFEVTLTEIDTDPPTVQCPDDITVNSQVNQQCTEVSWVIPFVADNSGGNVDVISDPISGTCFSDSVTVVTVTATDPFNNMNTCSFVVRVNTINPCAVNPCLNGGTCISSPMGDEPFLCLCTVGFDQGDCGRDVQEPVVICPGDITVDIVVADECGVATWQTPFASDNSRNDPFVQSSPPSGTCFFPGNTTVEVTASDQSGNVNRCTFTVTVIAEDNMPSTVVCPSDITRQSQNGECVFIDWTIPFAVDNAGAVDLSSDPMSGSCFEVGSTQVTVSARDQAFNLAMCTFTITVVRVEVEPPTVICPQDIQRMLSGEACTIVEWTVPFASGAGGRPVDVQSTPESGTCFMEGVVEVIVTAVDDANSLATCTFSVTVSQVDNTGPIIENCPTVPIMITLPTGDTCTPIVWTEPTATDDDNFPPSVQRFPADQDCFAPGEVLFTYVFTDQAGNFDICAFSVFIRVGQVDPDTTAPVIQSCPSQMAATILLPGDCAVVTWIEPTASDDSITVVQGMSNFDPGFCFTETSMVVYTFTDPSGNTATCSFDVIVTLIDVVSPVVTGCPDNINLPTVSNDDCTAVNWVEPEATDAVSAVLTVTIDSPPGNCFPVGSTTVTYTFSDEAGNEAICVFIVTIEMTVDVTPPVIQNCPTEPIEVTIPAEETCTPIVWAEPTAIDDDNFPPRVQRFPDLIDCFGVGDVTFTYIFSDQSSNFDICTFSVIISQTIVPDTTDPEVLTCPPNLASTVQNIGDCAEVTWIVPIATDDSVAVIGGMSNFDPGFCFPLGLTPVVYTFTDPSGNSATCTFEVTVTLEVDTTIPVVLSCPSDIEGITMAPDDCTEITWTAPIATDDSSAVITGTSNFDPGFCFTAGTTLVTYTFRDPQGNTATCSFDVTITFIDVTPPVVISCPSNIEGNTLLPDDCAEITWTAPLATDESVTVLQGDSNFEPGFCFPVGLTRVVYTFTDPSENVATCAFDVIVNAIDVIPPVISGCPSNIRQEASVTGPCTQIFWIEPTAFDAVSGTPALERNFVPGDCFDVGTTVVIYTFTDAAGNRETCLFNVVVERTDDEPPNILSCPGDIVSTADLPQGCATVFWMQPVALDAVSGIPMMEQNFEPGFCFPIGVTTVTYTFTDASGNQATCEFNVRVDQIDNRPPVIQDCPEDIFLTAPPGAECVPVIWPVPTATDDSLAPVEVTSTHGPGDCFSIGTNVVRYTFVDPAQNSAVCTFVVEVEMIDNQPPLIGFCPDDMISEAPSLASCANVFWSDPFAIDIVSGVPRVQNNFFSGECFPVGTTVVRYDFTDEAGNTATCSFVITVSVTDSSPPVIISCPNDITQQSQTSSTCTVVTWGEPTAFDDQPGVISTTSSHQPGNCFPVARTVVTYSFTDVAGNTAMCVFAVTVIIDTQPPIISDCPNDILETAPPGASCSRIFWEEPTAVDAVSGIPMLERNFSPGFCFTLGQTDVVYTFVDASGNVATCQFSVTISRPPDFIPPSVENCPGDISLPGAPGSACQSVAWVVPTATDNIPGEVVVLSTHDPGDCFPFTETLVVYTFFDQAGNSATCAFNIEVFVLDVTPPTITNCPDDIVQQGPQNSPCQALIWIEPEATDDSGGPVMVERSRSPGECFEFGPSIVTYTFTDTANNMAFCSFTIQINRPDTVPPVISDCPDDITLRSMMTEGCVAINWIEPTATDDTSVPVLLSRTNSPGDCLPEGPTIVVYRFADLEGNEAICSFIIDIIFRDVEPPVVSGCPTDIVVQAPATDQCAAIQWLEPSVTDNSADPVMTMQTAMPGNCLPFGETLISYIFTDSSGNIAACTFTITVLRTDVVPPIIQNCPDDITLEAINNNQCLSINWIEPFGIDDSPGQVTIRDQTHRPGDCFSLGDTVVTYVLRDVAGNTATCIFTITVTPRDENPPIVVFCPSDLTLEAFSNEQCLVVSWEEPIIFDDRPGDIATTQTAFSGMCFPAGTQNVIYTFTDAAGNEAICTFSVTIIRIDNNPPVVDNCPTDITLFMTPNTQCLSVSWVEPTATDFSPPITVTLSHPLLTCFEQGETTVQYLFEDSFGNTATCSFIVSIQILDNTDPVITFCPDDIVQTVLPPLPICTPVSFIEPTATDDSPEPLMVVLSHMPNDCFQTGSTTSVSYTFIDSSGNLASCVFMVRVDVQDTDPPIISGCPSDIALPLLPGQFCVTAAWTTPTATDVSPPVTSLVNFDQNFCFPQGQNEVVYTFLDAFGNDATCSFLVVISPPIDTDPPVITGCPSNIMLTLAPGQFCLTATWTTPTAVDVSPPVMSVVNLDQNFCFPQGQNEVIYTFTDSLGNADVCSFLVVVSPPAGDLTDPVVETCPASFTMVVPLGQMCVEVSWAEPVVTDNSGIVTIVSLTIPQNSCLQAGQNEVVYVFSDPAGNTATCTFVVNVIPEVDLEAPVVQTCPEPFTLVVADGQSCVDATWPEPVVTDNSGIVNIDVQTLQQNTCLGIGLESVVYAFSDPAGNVATCVFTIMVEAGQDVTSPVLSPCPPDQTAFVTTEPCLQVIWEPPTTTDDSGMVTVVSDVELGFCFPVGQRDVTYTATDPSNNVATCTFIITILVDMPPVISDCPTADIESGVPVGAGCTEVTWTVPTVIDDRDTVIPILPQIMPGDCLTAGVYDVVYIYVDLSNQATVCSFRITVTQLQDLPPVVAGCPMDISATIPMTATCVTVEWPTPTASDDTGPVVVTPPATLPGMCLEAGIYNILYVFTDQSSQQSSCAFTVTVTGTDVTPPVVSNCPESIVLFVQAGNTATATWTEPTAQDNSGLPVMITQTAFPGVELPVGDLTVTYTFTDQAGNNAPICQFTIVVIEDNELPMIMGCPMDFVTSVSLNDEGQIFEWNDPTVTDNSGRPVVTVFEGPISGTFFPIGTFEVVQYTYTDEAGNSAQCTFVINVQMSANPLVVTGCSEDLTLSAAPGEVSTMATWPTPTATGVEPISVMGPGQQSGGLIRFGNTEILYRFTDGNQQSAECRFTITVIVTPLILDCPMSFTVDALPGTVGTTVDWTVPTAMGVEPFQISLPDFAPGDFLPEGDTVISYTFTDDLGQTVTCEFTVTVNVLASPPIVISDCPVSFTVDAPLGQSMVVAEWSVPTATGFQPILLTGVPPFIPGVSLFTVGMEVELVYSFTDGVGMTMDCRFTITARDVSPPTIVIPCPVSPVIQFIGPLDVNAMVMWTEPMAVDDIPGQVITTVSPDTNIFTEGVTSVTYTFTDQAGNVVSCGFDVSVIVDAVVPVIVFCPPDISGDVDIALNGQRFTWPPPVATDNVQLSPDVVITGGNPDTVFPVGITMVTYTFSDIFGNTADCTFNVEVIGDMVLPVITGCPMAITAFTTVGVPTTVDWVPPTAVDNSGGTVTTFNTHSPNESLFPPDSVTTVTYTFTDGSGNAAICQFQVTVIVDSLPPTVMGCPDPITIDLDPGLTQALAQWVTPTGTDNSNLPVVVELEGPASGSLFPIGITQITYRLTDSVGLQTLCQFLVTVNDVTPPQVLNCPMEGITVFTNVAQVFVDLPVLQVTDDTGVMPMLLASQNIPDQQLFPIGITPLTYTYTDGNGNFATCQFSVTVQFDNTPPLVTCPAPIEVFVAAGIPSAVVTYDNPTVIDDSGLVPSLVTVIGTASGGLFPAGGQDFVSFQYSDAAGNLAGCTLPITVTVDTIPPVVTCVPTAMAFASATANQALVVFDEPTATDNSGLDVSLMVSGPRSGSVFPAGVTTTIYTFTDSVGLSAVCQVTVTVEVDTTPPAISDCSEDVVLTVPNTQMEASINLIVPTATDNSMEMTMVVQVTGVNPDNVYPVGVTIITYIFADNYDNLNTCQFTVTVVQDVCNPNPCDVNEVCSSDGLTPASAVCTSIADVTAPVVTGCPADAISLAILANNPVPIFVPTAVPTATDDSGVPPTVTVTGLPEGNLFPEGATTVTYTFSDQAGNTATCVFQVFVDVDHCNPDPCPMDSLCAEGNPVQSEVTCTPLSCNAQPCIPGLQLCIDIDPPDNFICVDMADTIPPVISGCPAAAITEAIPSNVPLPLFVNVPVPMATDNSLQAPSVSVTNLPPNGFYPEGTTTVTYTFTDGSGNSAQCVITVLVDVDYCNPNPCLGGILCTEGDPVQSAVTCGAITCSNDPCLPVLQLCVDLADTFICVDLDDTISPVISGCPTQSITQVILSDTPLPTFVNVPVPTATDNSLQAPIVDVTGLPAFGQYPEGTTTVTYTFTDGSGNTAQCVITVIVDRDFCNPNPCGVGVVCMEGATDPMNVICGTGCNFNSCPTNGDFCFLQGTAPSCVTVGTNPLLTDCPATPYLVFSNTGAAVFDVPVPSLTDFPMLAVTTIQFPVVDTFAVDGSFVTVTFTLMDDAGATIAACEVLVIALPDTTPPVVTACPDPVMVNVAAGSTGLVVLPTPTPAATDTNGVTVQTDGVPANDFYPVGVTTVTYTFSDPAGNTAQCVFVVEIVTDPCTPSPCAFNQNCRVDANSQAGFSCVEICGPFTCPGQLCFNDFGLSTGSPCVAVPTSTALGNCPSETVMAVAQFGAITATVNLPVPFLLEFPNYPTSIIQSPQGNEYSVDTITAVNLLLFDDALNQIAVCNRNVQVTAVADNSFQLVDCDMGTLIVQFVAPGTTNSRVFFNEPSTVGGQGEVTLTTGDFTSGSVYPVGLQTSTFIFTDSTGQSLTCQRTISVTVDDVAPEITGCNSLAVTTVDRNTNNAIVLIDPEPQATDNSGSAVTVTTQGIPADNVYPVGINLVTYIFTDAFGNVATCGITVTVDQDLCNPNPCPNNAACTEDGSLAGFSCAALLCSDDPCLVDELCVDISPGEFICVPNQGRKKRSIDSNDELNIREARAVSEVDDSTYGPASLHHIYLAVACLTGLLFGSVVTIWLGLKRKRRGMTTIGQARC